MRGEEEVKVRVDVTAVGRSVCLQHANQSYACLVVALWLLRQSSSGRLSLVISFCASIVPFSSLQTGDHVTGLASASACGT